MFVFGEKNIAKISYYQTLYILGSDAKYLYHKSATSWGQRTTASSGNISALKNCSEVVTCCAPSFRIYKFMGCDVRRDSDGAFFNFNFFAFGYKHLKPHGWWLMLSLVLPHLPSTHTEPHTNKCEHSVSGLRKLRTHTRSKAILLIRLSKTFFSC